MEDVGNIVDEYEVARKILSYSVSNPQSKLMEEIGRLIRPSFFPGLMTGDLRQMTPAEVGALKPRRISLAARARTIIRAVGAVNRVAKGFNEGGPKKAEASIKAFMALGEYLAQKMPNAISGPISAALSSPAPRNEPTRVWVSATRRVMPVPDAPETVRLARTRRLSTAEEQIAVMRDVSRDTTPTAIRPAMRISVVPTKNERICSSSGQNASVITCIARVMPPSFPPNRISSPRSLTSTEILG
jgi:hypothetical protein